jgi:MFS family permease
VQVFFQLHLPAIALGIGMGATVPVIPEFAKSFGVGPGQASLVFVANALGGLTASVPVGYMLDRIGRRRILILGPGITALSAFLVATSGSFTQLLIYRYIGGWGTQMWTLSRLTMIADTNSSGSRGRMITSLLGIQHVGTLAGPLLGGFLAVAYGLEVAFIVQGMTALVAMMPGFFARETAPGGRPVTTSSGRGSGSYVADQDFSWRSLLARPIPIMFLAQWMGMTTRGGIVAGSTVFVYAAYAYDADPRTLGVLSSLMAGAGITTNIVSGLLDGPFREEDYGRAGPRPPWRGYGISGCDILRGTGFRLFHLWVRCSTND